MTWADGYSGYLGSYEVRLYRRRDTYAGREWTEVDPPVGLVPAARQLQIATEVADRRTA